jgi:hypothetical protein
MFGQTDPAAHLLITLVNTSTHDITVLTKGLNCSQEAHMAHNIHQSLFAFRTLPAELQNEWLGFR